MVSCHGNWGQIDLKTQIGESAIFFGHFQCLCMFLPGMLLKCRLRNQIPVTCPIFYIKHYITHTNCTIPQGPWVLLRNLIPHFTLPSTFCTRESTFAKFFVLMIVNCSFHFIPSSRVHPFLILQGRERASISSRPLFCSLWLWNYCQFLQHSRWLLQHRTGQYIYLNTKVKH